MNRRALFGTALVALAPPLEAAAAKSQSDTLKQFIEEVIEAGDMSNLNEMVSTKVVIAVLGVNDIDGFRRVSEEGFAARSEQYATVDFDILSIVESDEWAHALVRFVGEKKSGRNETRSVFYVAQFRDNLIVQLYLG